MLDWFIETGIYLLAIALIPGVGLLLVCWGLWGDRSKGRVRCPKCWYDMRGTVPRLECPECGHDAQQARWLYRTRRGRRRMVVGVALVLLSTYPLAIIGGWYREQAVMHAWHGGAAQPFYARSIGHIGPDWIVRRLPEGFARYFDRRTSAAASTDEDLAFCAKLRHVRKIHAGAVGSGRYLFYESNVTDAGLVHLKGMTRLQELNLSGTQVRCGLPDRMCAVIRLPLPRGAHSKHAERASQPS